MWALTLYNYLDYQTVFQNAFDIPPLMIHSNQNQAYWNQR